VTVVTHWVTRLLLDAVTELTKFNDKRILLEFLIEPGPQSIVDRHGTANDRSREIAMDEAVLGHFTLIGIRDISAIRGQSPTATRQNFFFPTHSISPLVTGIIWSWDAMRVFASPR
jgi:hypothetical protein